MPTAQCSPPKAHPDAHRPKPTPMCTGFEAAPRPLLGTRADLARISRVQPYINKGTEDKAWLDMIPDEAPKPESHLETSLLEEQIHQVITYLSN